MSSKQEKDRAKQLQDKCTNVLNELLRDGDNKYCVDCDSKGPRWASWNIGVFLCIRCAGIHRNLGVHISKVKSVNLDAWTPEQVVSLQQMGNSRGRAVYEANLPDNFRRPQSDSSLESFIRAKYEHKKYIAREWVAQPMPKVNWEKEIDEEIERQKKKNKKPGLDAKLKTTTPVLPVKHVEIPQIPKPKTATSTNRSSPKPQQKPTTNDAQSATSDLLGLTTTAFADDAKDDTYSGFVSAPNTDAQLEEKNFFNQSFSEADAAKNEQKMTKDSIMALYANTPNHNQFMMQPNQFSLQPTPGQTYQVNPQMYYATQQGQTQLGVVQKLDLLGQTQPVTNNGMFAQAQYFTQNYVSPVNVGVSQNMGQGAMTNMQPMTYQAPIMNQPIQTDLVRDAASNPFFAPTPASQIPAQQFAALTLNPQMYSATQQGQPQLGVIQKLDLLGQQAQPGLNWT